MTVEEEETPSTIVKHKSLLAKYEIPIDHLDFEYIKKCNDLKELERIVKILRSTEEGYYPELLECAETKLKAIAPNHKLFRFGTPVLTKSSLSKSEWNELANDIEEWKDEIEAKEKNLAKNVSKTADINIIYPEVRRGKKKVSGINPSNKSKPSEKITSTDYNKWDQYDADAECLKMDLEEEKKKEQKMLDEMEAIQRLKKEKEMSEDEKELNKIREVACNMTPEEKEVFASKEKDLGNEFYRSNEFDKAIKHYTRSITMHPTAASYNNRAAAYLKQCKYSKALEDTNIVLEMEPGNVKAYFRRALSLQHKNEFHKALEDIQQVVKREPNHVVARHVADQLREHCNSLPKKVKLVMRDEEPNDNAQDLKLVEVTEDEMLRDYKDKKFVEVNDFGLPKIMCNCNGRYSDDPGIQHDNHIRFQYLNDRNINKKNVSSEKKQIKHNKMVEEITQDNKTDYEKCCDVQGGEEKSDKPKRLNIIELDRIIEDEDDKIEEKTVDSSQKIKHKPGNPKVEGSGTKLNVNEDNKLGESKCPEENIKEIESNKEKVFNRNEVNNDGLPTYDECLQNIPNMSQVNENLGESSETVTDPTTDENSSLNEQRCPSEESSQSSSATSSENGSKTKVRKKEKTKSNETKRQNAFEPWNSSQPIMIAKKYREKVSQSRSPKDGSVSDDLEKENKEVEETLPYNDQTNREEYSPFQFFQIWTSIIKDNGSMSRKAKLLRSVPPHLLQAVVGTKLDDTMLSNFLHCLRYQFSLKDEIELITEYLTAIMQVERFSIIYSFLTSEDKKVTQELIERLGPAINSHLRKAYL